MTTVLARDPRKAFKSKYRAQPVHTDEGYFASKREYRHWLALKQRQLDGQIRGLERQVRFRLEIGGQKICDYVADAVYFEGNKRIVADAKGVETDVFKLKRKLMKALLNIDVVTA